MAGYQPEYLNNDRSRTGAGSPLTPYSQSQPPSFKTNVNRQKTKRWVNAKTYTYDGDDWGESEDDDISEADHPQAPPVPENPTNRKPERAAALLPNQTPAVAPIHESTQMNHPGSSDSAAIPHSDDTGSSLPIVRPAEIYKRLTEERQKQQINAPNGPASSGPAADLRSSLDSSKRDTSIPVSHDREDRQQPIRGVDARDPAAATNVANPVPHLGPNEALPPTASAGLSAQLPELRPFSGFGESFLGSPDYPAARSHQDAATNRPSQVADVDRNNSHGFRSVVHQAFDVPDTPATDNGTVSRSDSNTTTSISPIMKYNTGPKSLESRAPTIQEEEVNLAVPRPLSPSSPEIKMGHRRSLTPPGSNNSPAQHAVLTTHVEPAAAQELVHGLHSPPAESGIIRLPEPETGHQLHQSEQKPPEPLSESDLPNQSMIQSSHERSPHVGLPNIETSSAPRINPPYTEPPSASTMNPSSAKELNDRLRDEIIRSLTPNPPQSSPLPHGIDGGDNVEAQACREGSRMSSGYSNEQSNVEHNIPHDISHTVGAAAGAVNNSTVSPEASQHPDNVASTNPIIRPPLKKKFSWEMDSDGDDSISSFPAAANVVRVPSPGISHDVAPNAPETSQRDRDTTTPPSSTISRERTTQMSSNADMNPIPSHSESVLTDLSSTQDRSAPRSPTNCDGADPPLKQLPEPSSLAANSGPNVSDSDKVLSFRDIMAMQTPSQKIAAFDHARSQFAAMDTGLQEWLQHAAEDFSDHTDLVQHNGALPPGAETSLRPIPTFTKIAKLASAAPARTHTRHSSGTPLSTMMHTQQVQAKGKDFLHSAGVLGGKAGDAAKGLFAKGRSKFRHSGSADKEDNCDPSISLSSQPKTSSRPSSNESDDTMSAKNGSGDMPRLASLKLDDLSFEASFGTKLSTRRSSFCSLPEGKSRPAFLADSKVRSVSSPAHGLAGPVSACSIPSPSIECANKPLVGHELPQGYMASESETREAASPRVHIRCDATEDKIDFDGVVISRLPSPDHNELSTKRHTESTHEAKLDSSRPGSTITRPSISREPSRSSDVSDSSHALLTAISVEITPGCHIVEPIAPSTKSASNLGSLGPSISQPPSPSPPNGTVSKNVEERMVARKFSFECDTGRRIDSGHRLVDRDTGKRTNTGSDSSATREFYQPSPLRAVMPGSKGGNSGHSIPPAPAPNVISHTRYLSVPTTHPAHQGQSSRQVSASKRASLPPHASNSLSTTIQSRYNGTPLQNSASSSTPSFPSNSPSISEPQRNIAVQGKISSVARPTHAKIHSPQPSSPSRPRSRLSSFFSKLGGGHPKTDPPMAPQQTLQQQPSRIPKIQQTSSSLSKIGTVHPTSETVKPAPSATNDVASKDEMKRKGRNFLRRFSYHSDLEEKKKFNRMGIKSPDRPPRLPPRPQPRPKDLADQPSLQSQRNPRSMQSNGASPPAMTGRFYQSLNTRLANISENQNMEADQPRKSRSPPSVLHSRHTSLSTVHTRYSVGGFPAKSPGSTGSTVSALSGSDSASTNSFHGRSVTAQYTYFRPRNMSQGQVSIPPSRPLYTRGTPSPSRHGGSSQEQRLLVLSHGSGPDTRSNASSIEKDLPPPPPPKIPLNDAFSVDNSPPSIRITSLSGQQRTETNHFTSDILPSSDGSMLEPTRPSANGAAVTEPVELSTHDDSSEEILMSSTSYPGQEWQPSGLGSWD